MLFAYVAAARAARVGIKFISQESNAAQATDHDSALIERAALSPAASQSQFADLVGMKGTRFETETVEICWQQGCRAYE